MTPSVLLALGPQIDYPGSLPNTLIARQFAGVLQDVGVPVRVLTEDKRADWPPGAKVITGSCTRPVETSAVFAAIAAIVLAGTDPATVSIAVVAERSGLAWTHIVPSLVMGVTLTGSYPLVEPSWRDLIIRSEPIRRRPFNAPTNRRAAQERQRERRNDQVDQSVAPVLRDGVALGFQTCLLRLQAAGVFRVQPSAGP